MNTEPVDLARSGKFASAMTEGWQYLVLPGLARRPAHQWTATLDQLMLLTLLDQLRYGRVTADERDQALRQLQGVIAELLGDIVAEIPSEATQFDLVLRAAELGALPYEAALAADGTPLFVRDEPRVIVTRRVRKEGFRESVAKWPVIPRVLYAWADPDEEVPHDAHGGALRATLRPWIEPLDIPGFREAVPDPDPAGILTVLPRATLQGIAEACEGAAREHPYSHIHLLAHGCTIKAGLGSEFGIALHDPDQPDAVHAVSKEALAEALCRVGAEPTVVTLAACDSANITNSVVGSSVAQELHTSGVPVVVASQLPLTVEGSTLFVGRFYRSLFSGEDVRCALHDARVELFRQHRDSLDWMSVVGYVQLPEGYPDMLAELRLASELASLNTAQRWYDFIIEENITHERAFGEVATQLADRITNLTTFLGSREATTNAAAIAENRGLLGSAEKRLAELLWLRSAQGDGSKWRHDSRDALVRARDWYRQAFHGHLASHWAAVQYLSLQAVLEGGIALSEWHTAVYIADLDTNDAEPYWKHGSLAELYLLAPKAGMDLDLAAAKVELHAYLSLSRERGDDVPMASTRRQLQRYAKWWTTANGFFRDAGDLSSAAAELLGDLD